MSRKSRLQTTWKGKPGNAQFDGLKSKNAELNSQEFTIDKTTANYTFHHLKASDELVKLKFNISEEFNGTLSLGNADDAEAYIANADMPHSGADVILLNKLLTEDAEVILTVSGNTAGAGWFKLEWSI